VRDALDQVREHTDYRVVAVCPFVAKWISEHPDYQDLLRR
jgi:predicted GNAT family acetyltransferase